ncbi:MAG: CDP-glycerol glycerophosphotransferase family protein [Clostridia bacterium]|nr:CDP-glycerol glycerophosphotransferase family protein [Clostridia bacterium]
MINAFLMHCFCILLRALYLPFKLLRPRHKAVFISRQGDRPGLDFLALEKELKAQDASLETVILCKYIRSGLGSKISYGAHMLLQMYHLATAKICILDGYCIAACVMHHHKQLKIYQLWHAVGLLKNFGYAAAGLKEGASPTTVRIMRMHRGYHRILCSSEELIADISRCYDAPEERFMPLGLPRLDFLTDGARLSACREKILDRCPELSGDKKIILHAPTFRKTSDAARKSLAEDVDLSRYHLVEKSHGGMVILHTEEGKKSFRDPFSGVEWISMADYVVTDYSAILFESLAADRPVILFCHDLEDYLQDRGFAIDYDQIPLPVCKTAAQAIRVIEEEHFDRRRMAEFCDHYVAARHLRSTEAIGYMILEELQGRTVSYEQIAEMARFQKK